MLNDKENNKYIFDDEINQDDTLTNYDELINESNDMVEIDNDKQQNDNTITSVNISSWKESAKNFKDINFKVSIIAGKVELSLSDLYNLKQGGVIDIGELPPMVKLVINDTVIGTGYLIEINGRIGVRVANIKCSSNI